MLKLVESKITNKSWFVDAKGKRVTPKFVVNFDVIKGPFRITETRGKMVRIISNIYDNKIISITRARYCDMVRELSPYLFQVESYLGDDNLLYSEEGKLIEDSFSLVGSNYCNRIKVKKDGKYGYIDDKGNVVIPIKYSWASDFMYGHAAAKVEGTDKYIVIDQNGLHILEDIDVITFLSNDLIKICKHGKLGVIDINGNTIVPTIYDEIELKDGYIKVRNNKWYGLYACDGEQIFDCIYSEIIETQDRFLVPNFDFKYVEKRK